MLVSYKHCPSGIAATLTSTTPLFVIPVVYFVYRQRVNGIAIAGAAVAFFGVCGLLLGQ
jgi:drug/metabolite transporter (DMT)-like permease